MPEAIIMTLGMYSYIMAPEPISVAYFINPSEPSVCVSLGRRVLTARNTRNSRKTVGGAIFYAVLVVSKKSLWVSLYIPLSLLGNGAVNTFPRQKRVIGGFVFYAVLVVSKKSLWVSLYIPLSLLGNGTVNTFPRQKRVIGGFVFYSVLVVSKKSLWVSLYIPLSLLGNGAVNTFPRQKKNNWRLCFLCDPCRMNGKQAISSYQNFLLHYRVFRNKQLRRKWTFDRGRMTHYIMRCLMICDLQKTALGKLNKEESDGRDMSMHGKGVTCKNILVSKGQSKWTFGDLLTKENKSIQLNLNPEKQDMRNILD
jgi:hypothetical protein